MLIRACLTGQTRHSTIFTAQMCISESHFIIHFNSSLFNFSVSSEYYVPSISRGMERNFTGAKDIMSIT